MAMGILDNAASEHIHSGARAEINAVTDFVEAAEYPETDDFFEHVYAAGN